PSLDRSTIPSTRSTSGCGSQTSRRCQRSTNRRFSPSGGTHRRRHSGLRLHAVCRRAFINEEGPMIRKLSTGEYRLYSRKRDPKTGRRRNLGTFKTRAAAKQHERDIQFFKRRG